MLANPWPKVGAAREGFDCQKGIRTRANVLPSRYLPAVKKKSQFVRSLYCDSDATSQGG